MPGPLNGYRIIELSGIGPGPFTAMMLADMGAEVVRVDRAQSVQIGEFNPAGLNATQRGRKCIAVDLKNPDGVETVLRLVEQADGLVEGFRPGVTERLGIGPDDCWARNPKLVYGRMTGWGQTGPYAPWAGHDLNYISLAGVAAHIGRAGQAPTPPLNLVGDYGGGGMLLAYGVVCALLEAQRSGKGQVVDAAMVDGAAILMQAFWPMSEASLFGLRARGTNLLDSGAPFYDVYECADGEYISIGSIESQFYAQLLEITGLADDPDFTKQFDVARWPELKEKIAGVFKSKTRAEWCELMEHTDVCFAPVLSMREATQHPHNVERQTFIELGGKMQAAPAPRLSRTPGEATMPPAKPGEHTREVLNAWGFDDGEIAKLEASGAIRQSD